MGKVKETLVLFVIFSLLGTLLEWAYGRIWELIGQTPWIYPESVSRYTSLEGVPLWGLGGLICVVVYRAFSRRNIKDLAWLIPLLVLAALWILVYELGIK